MAEENNPQAPKDEKAAEGPQFAVQRIYLKDMSFEAPQGAAVFKQKWQPKINQDLNTSGAKIEDDLYEVTLKLTVNVTLEEKTAFLIEVHQAGLFFIKGVEGTQLTQVLNTMCPQTLFPYAREAIDSAALKGGFSGLALPPVNFDVLFAQAVSQAQAEKKAAGGDKATN